MKLENMVPHNLHSAYVVVIIMIKQVEMKQARDVVNHGSR
jgi:hypothetical protein